MYISGIFPANRVSIYYLLYHLLLEPRNSIDLLPYMSPKTPLEELRNDSPWMYEDSLEWTWFPWEMPAHPVIFFSEKPPMKTTPGLQ